MSYTPHVGDTITLSLPDEITRAQIVHLVSRSAAIAELLTFTVNTKSHNYRKGDKVPCRYGKGNMGLNGWTAISDEELDAASNPSEVPVEPSPIREATYGDIFGTPERKATGKEHAA